MCYTEIKCWGLNGMNVWILGGKKTQNEHVYMSLCWDTIRHVVLLLLYSVMSALIIHSVEGEKIRGCCPLSHRLSGHVPCVQCLPFIPYSVLSKEGLVYILAENLCFGKACRGQLLVQRRNEQGRSLRWSMLADSALKQREALVVPAQANRIKLQAKKVRASY